VPILHGISREHYAMHATQLFIDRSGVPHAHVKCAPCMGYTRQKKYPFQLIVEFFLKGVVFIFWHDIAHIELLYCVTNFELVWTWNKVAVFENANKFRLHPTVLYHDFHWLLVATEVLTDKLHSLYVKESKSTILERSESNILLPTLHPANKL